MIGLAAAVVGFSSAATTVRAQPVRPFELAIVAQHHHYDCGPAALVTLIAARSGRRLGLEDVKKQIALSAEEAHRVQARGYSLLQLAAMAKAVSAEPIIWELNERALSRLSLPVLVYLSLPTGPHFSLVTAIAGRHVALADSSQGRLIWSRETFLAAWAPRGKGFVLSLTAALAVSEINPVR
jgi:predicted double-glycine peptidase